MPTNFTLATSQTLAPDPADLPLAEGVPYELLSMEQAQGAAELNVGLYVRYSNIVPDTANVAPFNFEVYALVEQKQADNSWEEIGRQNVGLRKLEQGEVRQIIVGPAVVPDNEGVDQDIPGPGGTIAKKKSYFVDDADGTIRVRVFVVDFDPTGPNPFQSVDVSINGNRY